jgi:hypothetical protein
LVNKRDVTDKTDEDLSSGPQMIKAFRDTWELGIHSYLTYLRDRFLPARVLRAESNQDAIEAYRGTESLPFSVKDNILIAVKIAGDRGIESLRVIPAGENE